MNQPTQPNDRRLANGLIQANPVPIRIPYATPRSYRKGAAETEARAQHAFELLNRAIPDGNFDAFQGHPLEHVNVPENGTHLPLQET